MDMLYSVCRKQSNKWQPLKDGSHMEKFVKCLIRISSNNMVAWVTRNDLNDEDNTIWGSRVYVADLNMPWNCYKITWTRNKITCLEWDICGEQLLVADNGGSVAIWAYKDHIFNDWSCIFNIDLIGECTIAGAFFHSGIKITFMTEKKDSAEYYEKFNYVKFVPTVRAKGGSPMEGCVVISSTGMLTSIIFSNESDNQVIVASESIAIARYNIVAADLSYGKNGHLFIATTSGSANLPIRCFDVLLTCDDGKTCQITSQPMAGFFVDDNDDTLRDNSCNEIFAVRFVVREAADSLIVVSNSKHHSIIQIWQLMEDGNRFNHLFTMLDTISNSTEVSSRTLSWKCQCAYKSNSCVSSIATPKVLITNVDPPTFSIVVSFTNNHIKVLSHNLEVESSYEMNKYWDSLELRMPFTEIRIADIQISWVGSVVIVLDTLGNFYLFNLATPPEKVVVGDTSNQIVSYATMQLEFCLLTGYDWWDTVISMKADTLEAVCEKFTENFHKQQLNIQQFEYSTFLSIKASLSRMLNNGHIKSNDLLLLFTLHAISTAFKSLLRPSELSSRDKGPGESLAAALSDTVVTDVDSVLVHIEAKEFTVEPSTLQSLQQLIQWVADVALSILARVPDHRKSPGYDIVTDCNALNMLRETLVIIRVWGLLRQTCLPVFNCNVDRFDGLSILFRLISRLMISKQNNEVDELLIDECCLLQNQLIIPTLSSIPQEICDIASPALYIQQSFPVKFVFDQKPESFTYEMDTLNVDAGLQSTQPCDVIRHVYLGKYPLLFKQCNRCEGKAHVGSIARTAAMKSWENRWVKSCLCGGKWRYVRSKPPMYSRNLHMRYKTSAST